MDKMNIKQYVVSHKTVDTSNFGDRVICYVNKDINKENTPNSINTWEKDNIDDLNKFYCELTALYWIWKNDESDLISFEHYRRLFISPKHKFSKKYFLNKEEINNIFADKQIKIIVPYKVHFRYSVYKQYVIAHNSEDLDCLREQIKIQYPSYLYSFDDVMNGHEINLFNMFTMRKEDLNNYCEFAFNLLNKVFEIKKEDILSRNVYQERSIGFLAERLFNVWIANNFKKEEIYHIQYLYFDSKHSPFIRYLANKVYKMLNKDYIKYK